MPGTFYSCYYHISLKTTTLSFSHTTPVTLAKHVHLQSTGTRAWRCQQWNCPRLQGTVTLSLSHSAPCTTSCTQPHPSYPAFLMVFRQFLNNPHCSVPPSATQLEILCSLSQIISLASSLVSLPPACPYTNSLTWYFRDQWSWIWLLKLGPRSTSLAVSPVQYPALQS